ncbi:MAG: hypothetical protein JXB34_10120 [Bacteroidales bacterium]|nr:hypothetical protein [Bacteroidales bacterium]
MFRITKFRFYSIALLILLLPLSSGWRLLFFGQKTTGIVVAYDAYGNIHKANVPDGIYKCLIYYKAGKKDILAKCPADITLPAGKEVTVYYNQTKPEKFLMFSFAGLFLSNKVIFPAVLLILWIAFYSSYSNNKNKGPSNPRLNKYKQKLQLNRQQGVLHKNIKYSNKP